MRLKVGDVEIEAGTKEDFEFLAGKIAELRGVTQPEKITQFPARPKRLRTDGVIHRTQEEIGLGLDGEQARTRRIEINAANGYVEGEVVKSDNEKRGEAFRGESLDLTEVPIDDEDSEESPELGESINGEMENPIWWNSNSMKIIAALAVRL